MPAVARKDKKDSISTGHGCDGTTTTDEGSSTVFINGIGACRKGDAITVHTIPAGNSCVPHTAVINAGSGTVFANGIAIARKGDSADAGNISSGSADVFAGG